MMNQVFIAAFADELSKIAAKPPAPSALRKWGPHITSAIAGGGRLRGAQRLYKDVQLGEEQRKMAKQQQMMGEM